MKTLMDLIEKGENVVYRGGHHIIVCNPETRKHFIIFSLNGHNPERKPRGGCSQWVGEHDIIKEPRP